MGGGSTSQSSSSRPLTGAERKDVYDVGMQSMAANRYTPKIAYTTPAYVERTPYKTLTDGDYNKLQADIYRGTTAPLDAAKANDTQNFNNSAGAKGIWSSGLALKGEQDISRGYSPQYAKAGSDATAQRYALQSQELQGQNTANQSASDTKNAWNMATADKEFAAKWKLPEYLQGMWNGTGGAVSSGAGGGWNFNI